MTFLKNMGFCIGKSFNSVGPENIEGFTNITKTVSAGQDEEIWIEILSYKDSKHKDEVTEKMKNDKNCESGYQQFLDLITPGSNVIHGDFSRLNDIGFV